MATPGALFELVARGVKDTYISTTGEQSGTYINPYTQVKDPVQPIIKETRLTQAKSLQPIEFDVDIFGDIIESLRFKVTFPSWLPSELPIQTNQYVNSDLINKLYVITDSSGISYSLTPYAAYFLFKKISIYQDNQIIYSIDGDGLFALDRENSESLNNFWLHNKTAGSTAKGRQFWINIPFPGTQQQPGTQQHDKGFPICAMYGGQQFRIRCELRSINELITPSQPWNKQLQYTMSDSTVHTFQATTMQPILVELENTQLYIDNDARDIYARMTHNIIFKSPFTNTYDIIQQDYEPLARGAPEAIITRQIDGRHPSSEVIIMTRPKSLLQNNQYVPTLSGFYTNVRMTIAGQEREAALSETVLGDLTNLIKKSIYREENGIIRYNWEIANQVGTINFTTASKTTIHFSLSPTLPSIYIASGLIQNIYVVGWAIYQIKDGRGKMLYYN